MLKGKITKETGGLFYFVIVNSHFVAFVDVIYVK